mgnify:CR=1 FL=1
MLLVYLDDEINSNQPAHPYQAAIDKLISTALSNESTSQIKRN